MWELNHSPTAIGGIFDFEVVVIGDNIYIPWKEFFVDRRKGSNISEWELCVILLCKMCSLASCMQLFFNFGAIWGFMTYICSWSTI